MKTISVCLLGLTWISSTLADEMPPAIRYAEHAARSYELETLKFQLEMLQAGRESAGEELAPEEEEWFAGGILKRQIRQAELVTEEVRASRVIIDCGLGVDRKDEPLPPLPPMLTGRILDTRKNFVEISLGSDDGLLVGHLLDVHRNGERGCIVIRHTDPDRAVGEVIAEFQKRPIRKGDLIQPHWEQP